MEVDNLKAHKHISPNAWKEHSMIVKCFRTAKYSLLMYYHAHQASIT